MRLCLIAMMAALGMWAEIPTGLEKQFSRLSEEAEIFAMLSTKVIGHESLEQVALQPPPRFQPRNGGVPLKYRTRNIVSEYGFSAFQDDKNLHEIRSVMTVDGKAVKEKGKLRETLTMGMQGDGDKMKRKLLKDFESYGLRQAATDFGQLILMFSKRGIGGFEFTPLRSSFSGADKVVVIQYQQKDGDSAMTVFEGKRVVRHPMRGELHLREEDGVPVKITLDASRREGKHELKHHAVVDYTMSPHGLVLPVYINYAEAVDDVMLVENRFHYTDFKIFGASSELKFTVEDSPPPAKR